MALSDPAGVAGLRNGLTELAAEPNARGNDLILSPDSDIGHAASPVTRFEANLDAVRLVKKIEAEKRPATAEEKAVIGRFSGWGDSAFNGAFPADLDHYESRRKGKYPDTETAWSRRGDTLRSVTTPDEYKAIALSRINAFYTTPTVINAMWHGLGRMGVNDLAAPRVMEPSAGSGRFLGLQPVEMAARSRRTAVELDSLTGRMLKLTYPASDVYVMGFQEAPIPDGSVDVAISNVPFGNVAVHDPVFLRSKRKPQTRSIHDYFFAKTLDKLRPGGVLAFVTSHYTMDSKDTATRDYLADRADFVGAIRLPETAFPDTAVVTDVIFMRKRLPGDAPGDRSWIGASPVALKDRTGNITPLTTVESPYKGGEPQKPINVSDYYLAHPENILGVQDASGSMATGAPAYNVKPRDGESLDVSLRAAIDRLPQNIVKEAPAIDTTIRATPAKTPKTVRNGSYVVKEDGSVAFVHNDVTVDPGLSKPDADRVKAMLHVRDAAKTALAAQLQDASNEEVADRQQTLNAAYDAFVTANGPLKSSRNSKLMAQDADGPFLEALEEPKQFVDHPELKKALTLEPGQIAALKVPLFTTRVVKGLGAIKNANSASDAMSLSLNETGRVDFKRMGTLLGRDPESVKTELAQAGLIFKNPVGDWEEKGQYLSGNVREKLKIAQAATSVNPAFISNVEALLAIQPADLPASQISVRMGTQWVAASDFEEFAKQLVGAPRWRENQTPLYTYHPVNGQWAFGTKANKGDLAGSEAKMEGQWGTQRMPADQIIQRLMTGQRIQVLDAPSDMLDDATKRAKRAGGNDLALNAEVDAARSTASTAKLDKKGNEVRIQNPRETLEAQEKAAAIEEEFGRWIWTDPDRAKRLSAVYNESFNSIRPRTFDGSHQTFPGMATKWTKRLHKHQKDSIWRVTQDGTTLLAHEVGFGKTAVMVASGMELRRLGLARKNLYVVPKATYRQFVDDFKDTYPYASVLSPTETEFNTANRAEFQSRIATGDWDAVVLSYEQYESIPVRPSTEAAFLIEEIAAYEDALHTMETVDDEKKKGASQKQFEKRIENMRVKLRERQLKAADNTDRTIYFEDLGIDQLFVDEADNYKNLGYATAMTRVKGLPATEAQRSWDMYQKVRYLQQQGSGRGVVFATGTPVSNTVAELWTQMRYLQEPMLEEHGLQHFDAWAKTFGATTEGIEQTPAGKYRSTVRFAKFVNVPELSNLWQQAADIRTVKDSPEIVKVRPIYSNEKGEPFKPTIIAAHGNEAFDAYRQELIKRADEMKDKDPKDDNMLKLSGDARKASLDIRMVDPSAPENPFGKIPMAANKIAAIYKETTPDKGTQLVFLDLGTPKAKDETEKATAGDEDVEGQETAEETVLLKNVYGTIKEKLVAAGVPASEIAFAQDAKTQSQKKALYEKVNTGEIRVLIGSTAVMGAGVNVQRRAAALHHLDSPWKPRDIAQREGRILRQGNKVYGPVIDADGKVTSPGKGVRIYTYVTVNSFDEFMWQAIEAKARPIDVIMSREPGVRTIEDADSFVLTASDVKGVASGNPDVQRRAKINRALGQLNTLRGSHMDEIIRARSKVQGLPAVIERSETIIRQATLDVAELEKYKDAPFEITVDGRTYTEKERAEAEKALDEAIRVKPLLEQDPTKPTPIGMFKGLEVTVWKPPYLAVGGVGFIDDIRQVTLRSPRSGNTYTTTQIHLDSFTGDRAIARMNNTINNIPLTLRMEQKDLTEAQTNLTSYSVRINTPWPREAEHRRLSAELAAVERRLAGIAEEPGAEITEGEIAPIDMLPATVVAPGIAAAAEATEEPDADNEAAALEARQSADEARRVAVESERQANIAKVRAAQALEDERATANQVAAEAKRKAEADRQTAALERERDMQAVVDARAKEEQEAVDRQNKANDVFRIEQDRVAARQKQQAARVSAAPTPDSGFTAELARQKAAGDIAPDATGISLMAMAMNDRKQKAAQDLANAQDTGRLVVVPVGEPKPSPEQIRIAMGTKTMGDTVRDRVPAVAPATSLAPKEGTPAAKFQAVYTEKLKEAVAKHPEDYPWANGTFADRTPEDVAGKMVEALAEGNASLSPTIKSVAIQVGAKPTMAGIKAYLAASGSAVPAQPAEFYFNGDRAEYTGAKQQVAGGQFYEYRFLEGHKAGQTGLTQTPPGGVNPDIARGRAERAAEQADFRKLKQAGPEQREHMVRPSVGVSAPQEKAPMHSIPTLKAPAQMTIVEIEGAKDIEVMRRNAHFSAETERIHDSLAAAFKTLKRTREGSEGRSRAEAAITAIKRQDDALQAERNDGSYRDTNPYFVEYNRRLAARVSAAPTPDSVNAAELRADYATEVAAIDAPFDAKVRDLTLKKRKARTASDRAALDDEYRAAVSGNRDERAAASARFYAKFSALPEEIKRRSDAHAAAKALMPEREAAAVASKTQADAAFRERIAASGGIDEVLRGLQSDLTSARTKLRRYPSSPNTWKHKSRVTVLEREIAQVEASREASPVSNVGNALIPPQPEARAFAQAAGDAKDAKDVSAEQEDFRKLTSPTLKASTDEARIVASIVTPEGKVRRRITVKPEARLKLPLKSGETVTATLKAADGANVDQKRGETGYMELHGAAVTQAQIDNTLANQTPSGRVRDRGLENSHVTSRKPEGRSEIETLKAWLKNPGSADLRGVDTVRVFGRSKKAKLD